MKQIIKIALLLLLVGSGKYLFAQNVSDNASLLVGKWKLFSHWVLQNDKRNYYTINKSEVEYIEFNSDSIYISFYVNEMKNGDTCCYVIGKWSVNNNEEILLYDNKYFKQKSDEYSESRYADYSFKIYKLTPDELHIDAVYYTEEKGTSVYKRVKNR